MSDSDRKLLIAVIDRIIPGDDYPSASQAGVMNYLDRMFAGDARELAGLIEKGLAVLEATSLNRFGRAFVEADAESQDAMLADVENEPFFGHLVELTSEGFYADPGNGGNAGAIAWKMIGYEPRERGDLE